MSTCPQCGQENKEGARFCVKCGSQLETPAQPPPQQGETPPQAAPPIATPPAAPTTPPVGYAPSQQYAPRGAAYPPVQPSYGGRTGSRKPIFWIGAGLVLVSGVLVLISTWLAWGSGPAGFLSLSGWDWFDLGRSGIAAPGEVANAFFVYSEGYPLFTGLCSLIAGGIIALIGGLMLAFRSKGLGVLAIIFSIIALGMAVTNLTTILRSEGISVCFGMYIFIIFSLAGLVGGGTAMSG